MKCQSLVSEKISKNTINLLSAELAEKVVKVRQYLNLNNYNNI